MTAPDFQSLNAEVRDTWNANAAFWDERMGEGNDFHNQLIEPSQLRLLNPQAGDHVLDIACGNGQFARKLAQLGTRVLATDLSARLVEIAKARTDDEGIEYRVVDATDAAQLIALGEGRFDAAVCTMALMDMASIEPLATSLARLLKPGGRFVFSVCHPCFNSTNGLTKVVELEERDGAVTERRAIKIFEYATPHAYRGQAMLGQPVEQYYFHRPLHLLLAPFFGAGFVLDGLEEPVFNLPPRPDRPYALENFPEIPWALVCRLRLS
jgi:2-polyprenyl-3-methyl-5-hydroxy-6-metoxy-1,4-benzoquinol methylase